MAIQLDGFDGHLRILFRFVYIYIYFLDRINQSEFAQIDLDIKHLSFFLIPPLYLRGTHNTLKDCPFAKSLRKIFWFSSKPIELECMRWHPRTSGCCVYKGASTLNVMAMKVFCKKTFHLLYCCIFHPTRATYSHGL